MLGRIMGEFLKKKFLCQPATFRNALIGGRGFGSGGVAKDFEYATGSYLYPKTSGFQCCLSCKRTSNSTLFWKTPLLTSPRELIGGGKGTASTAIAVPKLKKLGLSRTKVALVYSWYHFVDVRWNRDMPRQPSQLYDSNYLQCLIQSIGGGSSLTMESATQLEVR